MSTVSVVDLHALKSRPRAIAADLAGVPSAAETAIRSARESDIDAIHGLVSRHLDEGRLLPRTREEIACRLSRFAVAVRDGEVVGCADLAPLGRRVAEVRSLVVDAGSRLCGIGRQLVEELERRATASGFETLTAFTHAPGYFAHLGFSIVPHFWVPEKIDADCRSCARFRACGQYAVMLPLVRTHASPKPAVAAHA